MAKTYIKKSSMLKALIVEPVIKRLQKEDKPPYYHGVIITEQEPTIIKSLTSSKLYENLVAAKEGVFVIITDAQVGPTACRLTEKSSVFINTAKFDYSAEALLNYTNPPMISIPDAIASPPKRRVSVRGTIKQINKLDEEPHYKKRKIMVEDQEGRKIAVKLWGDLAANPDQLELDIPVKINGLVVERFKEITSLNSTGITRIEIDNDEEIKDTILIIIGINKSEVITEDGERYTPICTMEETWVNMTLPAIVNVKVMGDVILEMTPLPEESNEVMTENADPAENAINEVMAESTDRLTLGDTVAENADTAQNAEVE